MKKWNKITEEINDFLEISRTTLREKSYKQTSQMSVTRTSVFEYWEKNLSGFGVVTALIEVKKDDVIIYHGVFPEMSRLDSMSGSLERYKAEQEGGRDE